MDVAAAGIAVEVGMPIFLDHFLVDVDGLVDRCVVGHTPHHTAWTQAHAGAHREMTAPPVASAVEQPLVMVVGIVPFSSPPT